jgi:hypothetical protein
MTTIGIDGTAENAVVLGEAISLTINSPPLDGSNNTNSNFVNDLGQAAQQLQQFARTNPTVGAAKTLLQGVALVPGLGTASSVVLLGIDLAQGDYAGVVGDALGLIPLGGGELAAGSRLAREASAIGREAQEVGIIENAVRTCGAGSFTAGTSVLTDKGSRPIEDVKVGERVLSRDERTGVQDWHLVMATTVNKEAVYKLHLHGEKESDQQEEMGVSAEHPFWVKGKGWTAAEDLKSGSEVQDAHGEWLQVGSFEPQSDEQETYNLTVEGSHSFFVSDSQVWVHNAICNIGNYAYGTYNELRTARAADAHHIFQDAAVRDLPGYSRGGAPAVQLQGPPNTIGTPHYNATQFQRRLGGGTFAGERKIAYQSLRSAGIPAGTASEIILNAQRYFQSLGVDLGTVTRTVLNRY